MQIQLLSVGIAQINATLARRIGSEGIFFLNLYNHFSQHTKLVESTEQRCTVLWVSLLIPHVRIDVGRDDNRRRIELNRSAFHLCTKID